MHLQVNQQLTDQDLILALQEGKPEALGCLYDKYSSVLLGLISRIMRDVEVAGELLQETFVAIWQQKDAYDATHLSLLSWLILVARDTVMVALKSGKYNSVVNNGKLPNFATEKAQNNNKNGFNSLEPDEKAVLDLIYLRGYTCQEAAEALGITVDILKTRLRRAGKHLREGGATQ